MTDHASTAAQIKLADSSRSWGIEEGKFVRQGWTRRRWHGVGWAVPAVKQLDKNFDPASEEDTYSWWESLGAFKPSSSGNTTPYVVCMPPPNVTGKLHMGHAMFVTLQDIMVRYQRMRGKAALWLPGTDHAGIATQMVVEKQLAAEGTSRRELGRQEFEARVWSWKEQYGGFITQQLRRLGASCDWTREHFTLDAQLSKAVNEAFVRLHRKGLIYRGQYLVNWAPTLQTAVSDLEVEYSDENGFLYFFKYPIAGTGGEEYLPVATTRPETILGDTAVAVNPKDPRFKEFIGKECEVPMGGGRCIPIIADEHVDMEFGTGALKITPAHDPNDYEIGKEQGLAMISIMNKDATMNGSAGKYCGLDRFDCRTQLWADMEDAKLTLKKEPYQTRIPRSQRGGEVIEPMVSEQWFVKMDGLADRALKAAAAGEVQIVPQRFEKIYNQWLESIQDWCISRQLWWGHRIPVWYVFPDEAAAAVAADGRCEKWVVARNAAEAQEIAEREHGSGVVLRQEEDVLDTWFSSGLWPFSTMGWPQLESPDLCRFYPTQVLETGHDILFFWVARMIMMALELTNQVPFKTVFLHGLVRDSQGRKMSKSLGNVLDPLDLIAEYGTDSLRYTLATGTTPGQDINLSMGRMLSSRNLTNKLWNAGKYLQMVLQDLEGSSAWQATAATDFSDPERFAQLPLAEKWIVSELHRVVDHVTELHEKLDMGEVGRVLYDFFWSDYADWYIEVSKTRTYSDDAETRRLTQEVLVYCFSAILKLWHPFMPYVTEQLWQALPQPQGQPALITAPWPATAAPTNSAALEHFSILQDIVRCIRNARAEYGVDLGRRIAATIVIQADASRSAVSDELAVVCLLAKLDPASAHVASSSADAPGHGGDGSGTIQAVVRDGVEVVLPLAGLFDAEKEIERLSKQAQKIEKELAGLTGRLSNKKFLEKAPKEVVEEAQGQAAELQEQLNAIAAKQEQMQQLL